MLILGITEQQYYTQMSPAIVERLLMFKELQDKADQARQ